MGLKLWIFYELFSKIHMPYYNSIQDITVLQSGFFAGGNLAIQHVV